MHNVALDEQRHIGFGVKLLRDLAPEDPEVPEAVAEQLRAVTPVSLAVFVPPGWDTRLRRVLRLHARADLRGGRAVVRGEVPRRRPAASSRCPGRRSCRWTCRRDSAPSAGSAMLRAGYLGERERPARARPGGDGDAVRQRAPQRRHAPRARRPVRRCSGSSPTPSRGTCGSTTGRPRRRRAARRSVDLELRCRFDDWVDVVAGRLDPRRAVATGRLRPRATPQALWRARGLFTLLDGQRHPHLGGC